MKWAARRERGDTLIEVLLAISILSLVMVSSIVLVNQGQAVALNALERSQAQALMNNQTALLTYLRDTYSKAVNGGQSPQAGTAAAVWQEILDNYTTTPNTDTCNADGSPNEAADAFYLTYNPPPATNPITLTPYNGGAASGRPQPGQGMWIEAEEVTATKPYIDFFVKSCWQTSGAGPALESKNIVRLNAPEIPVINFAPICVPTDIALVLDASTSMVSNSWGSYPTRMARLKEVAVDFVNQVGIGTNVSGAVISFNTTATLRQDLTTNIPALEAAINSITTLPATNYQPALNFTRTVLDGPRRRIMVFISDGKPSDELLPAPGVVALSTSMKSSDNIIIYSIGITAASDPGAEAILLAMSGNGGFYANAAQPNDLDNILNATVTNIGCAP